jgi:hypothetical protein
LQQSALSHSLLKILYLLFVFIFKGKSGKKRKKDGVIDEQPAAERKTKTEM